MRSCCVFDSLRLLHFLLFAVYLLSYRPVFPPGHQLLLPRCGGQIPCAYSANEDLGTLAEYDPLTGHDPNDYHGGHNDYQPEFFISTPNSSPK